MIDVEIEGFFNLIYSHLFVLHPPGTPEAKTYLTLLLQTISSVPSDRTSIKYRMCAHTIFREAVNSDLWRLQTVESIQCHPTDIFPATSGIQYPPRPCDRKRSTRGPAPLPRRCRKMAIGVGYHPRREVCILETYRRCLPESSPAVCIRS
jgi:hypothetical protein